MSTTPAASPPPCLKEAQVAEEFRRHFGLEATLLRRLPSERDQVFEVYARRDADSLRAVLKIANERESPDFLDLEAAILDHLEHARPANLSTPRLLRTLDGRPRASFEGEGCRHEVRCTQWIEGTVLARFVPKGDTLFRGLGQALGELCRALASFPHPAAKRELAWDLARAPQSREHASAIRDPRIRALVLGHLERFADLCPHRRALPSQVLHQDANDHNVLVRERAGVPVGFGLVDFGDVVHGPRVHELAVAAAYTLAGRADPLHTLRTLTRGFHERCPLSQDELALLFPAVCARIAQSVAIAAVQCATRPDDDYLAISQSGFHALLVTLESLHPRLAHAALRDACGLPAHPRAAALAESWSRAEPIAPLLGDGEHWPALSILDLSNQSASLAERSAEVEDPVAELVAEAERRNPGALVVGRYDEVRTLYQDESFAVATDEGPLPRTVHLGLDLFAPAGTKVRAACAGRVTGVTVDDQRLGYGACLLLEHEEGEDRFFTLYGHLRPSSVAHHRPGTAIAAGEEVAALGAPHENGGWAPHLHFQVILDALGRRGEFPGVALARDRSLWTGLCPDPESLLRTGRAGLRAPAPRADLELRRRALLGPNLGLSYRQPLTIVRGQGCELEDEGGRRYLDAVNNVPTVGHSHPRVVRALRQQAALLNTNTRYLHPLLVEYVERLLAKFPAELEVCFLTCSGSEANELALRLAHAATGARDVLVLDAAYHGNTRTLVELSPYKFQGPGGEGPAPTTHVLSRPDCYRGPRRGTPAECVAACAAELERSLAALAAQGRRPAAFLAESALGCGGQIVLPEGYLPAMYERARRAGAVCIADEVQTGFGRAGSHFWMFETQGVVPDVVTLGKPMGNGHPLAGVVTTRRIAEAFANGMEYFNTFGGNPVSCAVGLAALDVIEEEGLQENSRRTGAQLLAGLRRLQETHRNLGDVRGRGLFVGAELVLPPDTREPDAEGASFVVERCKEFGVLLSTDGPDHDVIKIKPPLCFGPAEADRLLAVIGRALDELAVLRRNRAEARGEAQR